MYIEEKRENNEGKINNIEKIIIEQFYKFYDNTKEDRKQKMSFLDDLITCKIMIYKRFEDYGILYKQINKIRDIHKENLQWIIEDNKRIPYLNGKKIECLMFEENYLNEIDNYIS